MFYIKKSFYILVFLSFISKNTTIPKEIDNLKTENLAQTANGLIKEDDEFSFTFQITNKKYPKPIAILKFISTLCALAGFSYSTWVAVDVFIKAWSEYDNQEKNITNLSKTYNRRKVSKLEWSMSESYKQSIFPSFMTYVTSLSLSFPALMYDIIKEKKKIEKDESKKTSKNKNLKSKNYKEIENIFEDENIDFSI